MVVSRLLRACALSVSLWACSTTSPIEVEDVSQPFDATMRDGLSDTSRSERASPGVDAGPSCVDPSAEHATLVAGVGRIQLNSNIASSYVIHGLRAFAVVHDAAHTPFVAASRAAAGRVFAVGHESLAYDPSNTSDDRGVLLRNAIGWLSGGRGGASVGVERDVSALRTFLTSAGYAVQTTAASSLDARTNVWVVDASAALTDAEYSHVVRWVEAGGGLLVVGPPWSSSQTSRDIEQPMRANRLLVPLGLALTTDTNVRAGVAITPSAPTEDDHAVCALDRVREHSSRTRVLPLEALTIAGATARRAVRTLPFNGPYLAAARAFRSTVPDVVPTAASPVRPATQPIEALTVTIDARLARELPVDELRAHPASSDFPGVVSNAVPRERIVAIWSLEQRERSPRVSGDSGAPVWRSVGAYAPPGEVLTVTVSAPAVAARLSVLIGAHTDDISALEQWERVPTISRTFEIRSTETRVASAFGGLVYVRFPAQFSLDGTAVTVTGGVRPGRLVLGAGSNEAWPAERARRVPWVELEGPFLSLTIPRAVAASIDDPLQVLHFWHRVSDATATLTNVSFLRARGEHFVFDRQTATGSTHAGYPLVSLFPQAAESVDLVTLWRVGHWELFHELARNHQLVDWTWSQTMEATAHLSALYAMQYVVGAAPRTGHPMLAPTERARRVESFIANGRNFNRDWNGWTALEALLQLQESFDWNFFHNLNLRYMTLPEGDRPRTDAEKIQRLVVVCSQIANRDLSPFFALWGFPLSAETRALTSRLPRWVENPMR